MKRSVNGVGLSKKAKIDTNNEAKSQGVTPNDDEDAMRCRVLDVAIQAARSAGMLMKKHCGLINIEKTKDHAADLATKIDMECEEIVKTTALRHFPDHEILGEESVDPGAQAATKAIQKYIGSEWLWVVDPIDGTTNFVHGLPGSVVSIGIAHKSDVVVAVIFDPYRDEMFTAIKGHGAYCNGQKIHVDSAEDIESGLFAMAPYRDNPGPSFAAIQEMYLSSRGVRDIGAAALHLAWTAVGRLSGFAQLNLCPWDLAAGSLLVEEAGGTVTNTQGKTYGLIDKNVCATNGKVHAPLLSLLCKHGAHDDEL